MADYYEYEHLLSKDLKRVLDRDGIQGLDGFIVNDLDKWKKVHVNIAVTGSSGAGKSSFINAMRGINQADKNAAKEGATETTKDQVPYCHPDNERIQLWDLPGVGTVTTMPVESYARKMGFDRFDFFVIVSSERFSKDDAELVRILKDLNKPFYLIRSKIGNDVENQKTRQTREEVLEEVRKYCVKSLRKLDVKVKRIYLIDNHIRNDFELGDLQMDLLHDAPSAKQTSLILTFENTTKEIIAKKAEVLRKRLPLVALKATLSAAPIAKYFIDGDIVMNEVSFYRKEFGLDDETLGISCKNLDVSMAQLKEIVELADYIFTPERVIRFCEDSPKSIQTLFMIKFFETIGDVVIGALDTYSKVYNGLRTILNSLEESAIKISENMLDKICGSTLL